MKFIAVDFETANFKRQSICAVGIAIVEDFKVVKSFTRLIKPTPDYYEYMNINIHNITPDMTENAPTFQEIWEELKPYFENQLIVAHNASFDMSALRYVLNAFQIRYPRLDYYCSMLLTKKAHQGLFNYQLPTVVEYFGIDGLKHHDAESDAIASAKIVIELCKRNEIGSLENLVGKLGMQSGSIYGDTYRPFRWAPKSHKSSAKLFDFEPDGSEFDEESPFFEKRVVFTGKLEKLVRSDAMKIVARIGGVVKPDNLSSKTNYLVVGTYDYNQYGTGYHSDKMKEALKYQAQGKDIEIISENEFYSMIHIDSIASEIKLEKIKNDSQQFIERNTYNELYNKKVFFSSDLAVRRTTAFQYVGNCGGFGHDYDMDEISSSDYFVIADKLVEELKKGKKAKSILDFEKLRNQDQNRGGAGSAALINEKTFYAYIELRNRADRDEIEMNIKGGKKMHLVKKDVQ